LDISLISTFLKDGKLFQKPEIGTPFENKAINDPQRAQIDGNKVFLPKVVWTPKDGKKLLSVK